MNRLTTEPRAQILGMMVEGNSIRAIARMTGAGKNTIIRLLEDAGEAFSAYQDRAFRDLKLKRIQLDEIWAFCYAKQRNVISAKNAPEVAGDLWTWGRARRRHNPGFLAARLRALRCPEEPKRAEQTLGINARRAPRQCP